MKVRKMLKEEKPPQLREVFSEIAQLRREWGKYAIDNFVDLFFDSTDTMGLHEVEVASAGYGAGFKLYHLSEGLVYGAIGKPEMKYFKQAQPFLDAMMFEYDREKKIILLFAELADEFIRDESGAFYLDYLSENEYPLPLERRCRALEKVIGTERFESLFKKMCGLFIFMPLSRAFRQGFFEFASRKLSQRNKTTGEQIWHEWCAKLVKDT